MTIVINTDDIALRMATERNYVLSARREISERESMWRGIHRRLRTYRPLPTSTMDEPTIGDAMRYARELVENDTVDFE